MIAVEDRVKAVTGNKSEWRLRIGSYLELCWVV